MEEIRTKAARCVTVRSPQRFGERKASRSGEAVLEKQQALCSSMRPQLLNFLYYYTGKWETAEDLTQDTLVRVCSNWRKVTRADDPHRYVFRIAVNLAKSLRRRHRIEQQHQEWFGSNQPDFADGLDQANTVRSAVRALRHNERLVILLRFYADFSVAQTCEVLGIPEGTVKTLTRRSLKKLQTSLGPLDAGEE